MFVEPTTLLVVVRGVHVCVLCLLRISGVSVTDVRKVMRDRVCESVVLPVAQILVDVLQSDGRLHHHSDKQVVNLYMSCPDLMYSAEAPVPRLGSGAFSILLQHLFREVTGRTLKLTMYGKPFPVTYNFAEAVLVQQAKGMAGEVCDGLAR